jgi:hypothetical protein
MAPETLVRVGIVIHAHAEPERVAGAKEPDGEARSAEQVSRGARPESPAQESRHGAGNRQRRQATRGHGQRAWKRRSRLQRLLRRESKAPLARHLTTPNAKLMARVGEEFPLECPRCGGEFRLIAFITEPGPVRKILTHLGEPLEPPPVSPGRGPPTDWGELVQIHDDRDAIQATPDELPVIDISSL